jgi:hypothetical protein
MRPQAAKRITNHAPQTPGHVHLAEYSPTSVTRNSHLRRIPGADLTVAGLVLPLASCDALFLHDNLPGWPGVKHACSSR